MGPMEKLKDIWNKKFSQHKTKIEISDNAVVVSWSDDSGSKRYVSIEVNNPKWFEAKDPLPLIDNARSPDFKKKEGEELVAALLAAEKKNPSGITVEVTRSKTNGRFGGAFLNDGADGEPARQSFYRGRLETVERYKDDQLNDGANGEAAFQYGQFGKTLEGVGYYTKGKETRWQTGKEAAEEAGGGEILIGECGRKCDGIQPQPPKQDRGMAPVYT